MKYAIRWKQNQPIEQYDWQFVITESLKLLVVVAVCYTLLVGMFA